MRIPQHQAPHLMQQHQQNLHNVTGKGGGLSNLLGGGASAGLGSVANPASLANSTGASSVGSVGSVTMASLQAAVAAIKASNAQPTQIQHAQPTIWPINPTSLQIAPHFDSNGQPVMPEYLLHRIEGQDDDGPVKAATRAYSMLTAATGQEPDLILSDRAMLNFMIQQMMPREQYDSVGNLKFVSAIWHYIDKLGPNVILMLNSRSKHNPAANGWYTRQDT